MPLFHLQRRKPMIAKQPFIKAGRRLPFFRLEGMGNDCTFCGKVFINRKEGFTEGILKGFARSENLGLWKYKKPQWVDIWTMWYWIRNRKFMVPFAKVIRGLSIPKENNGKDVHEIFILTRNAVSDKENSAHPRHPLISLPLFYPD